MNKNKLILIIFIPTFILLCIGGIFLSKKLTTVQPNPPGTIGNTAGNLQNAGLYCESDGVVFFANPYDNNSLYRMNVNETKVEQVNESMVKLINAGKSHIYYYQYDSASSSEYGFISNLGGIFRSAKKGGRTKTIKKTPVGGMLLVEDLIYYLNYDNKKGYSLYSIDTNRKNDAEVISGITDPCSYGNGKLYYCYQTSEQNHYLYSYDLHTKSETIFLNKDVWFPQISGNYLYYLDIHDQYALCRCNLSTKEEQKLISERIDCYNVAGDYIYYQVNSKDNPYIGMMRSDGTSPMVLMNGNFTQINTTSQYVYFNGFGSDFPVYHAPIGSASVSTFTAGKDAAMKK